MTKVSLNPIVRKDLKVSSRSMKFSWSLFAYEGVLALAFLLTMLENNTMNRYSGPDNAMVYKNYTSFFPIVGVFQLVIIGLIVPIMTAASISGEREKKTMDVLLTTSISPFSIIIGKLASAVIRVMIYVFASVPLMAVSFIIGGLRWTVLIEYIILAFFYAIFAGSIGIFCSAVCKKTITAVVLSYVIYFGIYAVTYVPTIIVAMTSPDVNTVAFTMQAELINPVHTFIIFFADRISGESLGKLMASQNMDFWSWLYRTNVWLTLSTFIQLGVSALFVLFSSNRLKPGEK